MLAFAAPARADSRSYVVSWFHIAASAYDDDCPNGLNPGDLTDFLYQS